MADPAKNKERIKKSWNNFTVDRFLAPVTFTKVKSFLINVTVSFLNWSNFPILTLLLITKKVLINSLHGGDVTKLDFI